MNLTSTDSILETEIGKFCSLKVSLRPRISKYELFIVVHLYADSVNSYKLPSATMT